MWQPTDALWAWIPLLGAHTGGLTMRYSFFSLVHSSDPGFLIFAGFPEYLFTWASSLTSDPSWVQGIYFPPSSLPHVAIFLCLGTKSWSGSFSASNHSGFFPELRIALFKKEMGSSFHIYLMNVKCIFINQLFLAEL